MKDFYLRKFEITDGDNLYEAIKGKEVVRHMATQGFSKEDCQWIVEDSIKSWKINHFGSWAVMDGQTEKMIGWAGFKPWNEKEIEILCVLHPDSWGLGMPIFNQLLERGFQEMGLQRVFILLPETRRSFHFVKSKGFKDCGRETFQGESFRKFVLEK